MFRQSNKEGELVELIQEARTTASGVILNAAGYTHTSVAILDALQMLKLPVIEVHLSNPARREEYRHHSYVAKAATGSITGLALNAYLLAIDAVAAHSGKGNKGMSEDDASSKHEQARHRRRSDPRTVRPAERNRPHRNRDRA